jgi:hypothetical protein
MVLAIIMMLGMIVFSIILLAIAYVVRWYTIKHPNKVFGSIGVRGVFWFLVVITVLMLLGSFIGSDTPTTGNPVRFASVQPTVLLQPSVSDAPTVSAAYATPVPTATPTPVPSLTPEQITTSAAVVSYRDLMSSSEPDYGEMVSIPGTVIQVMDNGDGTYTYLVGMTDPSNQYNYINQPVWIYGGDGTTTVLKGDSVDMYGYDEGTTQYTTVLGAVNEVPNIELEYIVDNTG